MLEDDVDHAVFVLDGDGIVSEWGAGARHLFGYPEGEIVGKPFSTLFTPEDVVLGMDQQEIRVAAEDARSEDDRWHVRKDGSRFWANGTLKALRSEDGSTIGFLKIICNRTEKKIQADALENQVAALNALKDRTTAFMGALAHELGNTFIPLGHALHLVKEAVSSNADFEHLLTLGERQLAVAGRLLNDLKDVTRIESGNLEILQIETCVNHVVERAVAAMNEEAKRRHQSLELLLPSSLITVDGDATRLHQVFTNLVGNACKYTPDGGKIWVKISTEGNHVIVKVQDTGVGISRETLPKLFEIFTQEESSLGRSQGGLGMGLWLVKNLVTLHGGTVSVRSDGKGHGSEFFVSLRIRRTIPSVGGDEPR
ncbi:PAS domain-containing sensor histidine kinase [Planctomyces sp. SH-PL14]|uniref:PAS domain-containing sensor histidine kinase n=1 Tax=Planctomyces sp. SH-PL14 TaxID=1632864 RepID=UPI0018D49B50|nr:PAS domain-containing sensor histidine kinase [Planctomyces sp. SH-PL14]